MFRSYSMLTCLYKDGRTLLLLSWAHSAVSLFQRIKKMGGSSSNVTILIYVNTHYTFILSLILNDKMLLDVTIRKLQQVI
jgi:hypothetical protein